MKLFIDGPENGGEGVYYLISEEGEALASHLCSHAGYAQGDLHDGRPERIEEYKKKYGEYEVVWLDKQTEITSDELVKRYHAWNLAHPTEPEE